MQTKMICAGRTDTEEVGNSVLGAVTVSFPMTAN